jgi:hemerythrin superfamily protein
VPQTEDSAKSGEGSGKTIPQAAAPAKALETSDNQIDKATVAAAKASTENNPSETKINASDAIALLKEDHRKVEGLFTKFESADDSRKEQIIQEACQTLVIHTLLEERLFYPAARQPSTHDMLDEAQVEHDAAKVLILELLAARRSDNYRDAKFKVLAEEIRHHVKEEEAPDGLFAKAQKAGVNTRELAERLTSLKRQLQQMAASGRLPDPEPASFRYVGETSNQERNMPTERDENGRFTSDDDHRSRSRGRDYDDDRNYRSRGSSDRERDSSGRFMSDEDDHRSRSRGRDDDDRNYRSGGSSDRERDSNGRFTSDDDDRGYRSRGSSGRDRDSQGRFTSEDDDRGRSYASGGGRGRDHGGWYGDREGHSEASRRGWDERENGSRGRSSRDDDDDRRYRSRAQDDDDRSSRGQGERGHGGWYGDSRGHAEASRRGWDERDGGQSSSRSEGRGYASRGRDNDDDDRGGSRSGARGHGGWSGDPQGHAEAARRGWENRR